MKTFSGFNFPSDVFDRQKNEFTNEVYLSLDPSISVRQVQSFVKIARVSKLDHALDLVDLKDHFNVTRSQASKFISIFLDFDYRKKKGLGLVSSELSERGRGAIAYRLTDRGNKIFDLIIDIQNAKTSQDFADCERKAETLLNKKALTSH